MADAVAILDGKTPEEAFVEALSKPGARLLVHPDDVERLLGPKVSAVPLRLAGVEFSGVEVQVSQWAPRGRLTVLGRDLASSPSVLPSTLSESFPPPAYPPADDGYHVQRCSYCGEPASVLDADGGCPSCARMR